MSLSYVPRPASSSKVFLEIDNRECAQSEADCFLQTEQAASFIAAEHLRAELPYPLVSVTSKYHGL